MQRNIPYYIPSLTELKFMADNGGFLMGKELQKLGEFLTGELGVKDEVIPDILRDVQSAISVGANLQTVIDELGNYGVVFSEQRELEKFSNVIIDLWNNTRMVMNHGYTPHELVRYGFSEMCIRDRHNAAGQFLICGFPSHTAFRDTGDVTYGLNCRYDEHDSNRDYGAGVKYQLYRHQLRNGKPAGFGNLIPV